MQLPHFPQLSQLSLRQKKILLGIGAILFVIWFVPSVFQILFGVVRYEAYESDSRNTFTRVIGPRAYSETGKSDWASDNEISSSCRAAIVTAEDARFYEHYGVDPQMFWFAIRRNWTRGKFAIGASTITQQLVKNLFLSRNKSLLRKSREIIGALLLDRILSKDSQLTWYLNAIEFGPHIYGIRAAAQYYFNKSPKELSLGQCIALYALVPEPVRIHNAFASGKTPQRYFSRQGFILEMLAKSHTTTQDEINRAASVLPLKLMPRSLLR